MDISDSENIQFDPSIGFTVEKTSNSNSLGIYRCTVGTLDEEDTLEFEVKTGQRK